MAEPAMSTVEELKQRAKAGDLQALQALRERGLLGGGKPVARGWPVSHAQRRLWIVEQMTDASGAYHIPVALRLDGPLDAAPLREALQIIVARHESLRTTFAEVDGELRQFIRERAELDWQDIDLSAASDAEARARQLAAEHAARPFDLAAGPLLRAALVRLGADCHLLLFNIHHIVADLLSLDVLVGELSAAYEARAAGREPVFAPLRIQYKDFAVWQNRLLAGEEGARHRAYWLGQLAGPLTPLDLPADFSRPPLKTFRGGLHRVEIDADLTERLRRLGLRHGMSLFMVLAAVLKVLLHRYTGQEDIIIGFPLAGRDHPDLAGQIGCFINTVALRDRLSPHDPFEAVLAGVRQTTLDAYEHQAYPFDRLVEELGLPRDMSRTPVFDVSISLATAGGEALRFGGVRFSAWDEGFATAKFDLSFDFQESGAVLEFTIAYAADLFSAARVRRMGGHFLRLADAATAHPEWAIGFLPLMPPEEERRVLVDFNATRQPFPQDRTLVDLFQDWVARQPEAVALRYQGRAVTYRELDRRANQLAGGLRREGVGPETLVGVFMAPGPEVVYAFLSILKAGGVYLPLDPINPPPRLAAMLDDARPAVILTQPRLADSLPRPVAGRVWAVDEETLDGEDDAPPGQRPESGQAAYAIFTSGSTGQPKAAVLLHGGLANMAWTQQHLFAPQPGERVLQFAALGFDASVFEMTLALAHGATLCLARREDLLPGVALLNTLEEENIGLVLFPPSALLALPDVALPRLRVLTVGGEACPAEAVARWAPGRLFFNLYGPTEATVFATAARCEAPDGLAPPIGQPIPNARVYLLDARAQPVPVGVPGELHIAGAGLARHYLNRPDLTQERFVPDIFDPAPGARLYRTGDLARWRADGAIEFLGRMDSQVKLRGYRIELGEIEAALASHPAVREALVLAREDRPGSPWLVGYATPAVAGSIPDTGALREHLRARLPDYMVPARFVVLDEFPLTPNKKIDRHALPAPADRPEDAVSFILPRDDLEHILAGLFAEILRVERVGAEDNFFELGGDSLLATRIVSRLRETFRADLGIPRLFRAGNVAGLALVLRELLPEGRADKVAAALRRLQGMSAAEKAELLKKKQRT